MPSKRPPMSIRPSEGQFASVLTYAERRGITVHAAVLELIDLGLAPKAAAAGKVVSAPQASGGPKLSLPVGPAPVAFGSRLKKR